MEKVRYSAVAYLVFQAFAVAAWWVVLFGYPEVREYFKLEATSHTSLDAFFLPDATLLAVGSVIAAWSVHRRSRFEIAVLWLLTGSITYATLYAFSFVLLTGRGWPGIVMMAPAFLWTGVFATALTIKGGMFRRAKVSSINYVLFKTIVQIVVVWGLILIIFPYLITLLEDRLGISRLNFPFQRPLAATLFVMVSSIGLYAAIVMSKVGRGTPLPLDHASDLVVFGPYAYVRNPMAVSGIGQGFAVALFLGSPLVLIYTLMGSAIWQFVFRPLEEDDLAERFGEKYEGYRSRVRCWVPRSYPYRTDDVYSEAYQIDGTADSSNSVDRPSGRI